MIREAVQLPHGPAFLSAGWELVDEQMPKLVAAVVTRVTAAGMVIPSVALVDRTCLGVKNAFVAGRQTKAQLDIWLDKIARSHGGIEKVNLLTVQSVVYNAIDYARSLGFEPHRDFPEALFGPRPAVLLDTPLAKPSHPIYVQGPTEDPKRVLAMLTRAVGEGNFGFVVGTGGTMLSDGNIEDEPDERGSFARGAPTKTESMRHRPSMDGPFLRPRPPPTGGTTSPQRRYSPNVWSTPPSAPTRAHAHPLVSGNLLLGAHSALVPWRSSGRH